jgi:hypothetical protein
MKGGRKEGKKEGKSDIKEGRKEGRTEGGISRKKRKKEVGNVSQEGR